MKWSPKEAIAEISGIAIAALLSSQQTDPVVASMASGTVKGLIKGFNSSKREQTPNQVLHEIIKDATKRALAEAANEIPFEVPDDCKNALVTGLFSLDNAVKYLESDDRDNLLRETLCNIIERYDECDISTIPVSIILEGIVRYIQDGIPNDVKSLSLETNIIAKLNHNVLHEIKTLFQRATDNDLVTQSNADKVFFLLNEQKAFNEKINEKITKILDSINASNDVRGDISEKETKDSSNEKTKVHSTKDYIVASICILGFANIVMSADNDSANDPINHYTKLFRYMVNEYKKKYNWEVNAFEIHTLLDTICISIPAKIENIDAFFQLIAKVQCQFVLNNVLLRGAITIGEHFTNDMIMFSKAQIAACNLEIKEAVYPRIILSDRIEDFIIGNGYDEDIIWYRTIYYWEGIVDNYKFVDYMNFMPYESDKGERLLTHKKIIMDRMNQQCGNEKIYEKCLWIAKYHNSFCQKQYRRNRELLIPID